MNSILHGSWVTDGKKAWSIDGLVNKFVDSFEVYYERNIMPLPMSLGTVAYSTGIFIPEDCWHNFLGFPSLFGDKLNIVCRGLDDQRKRDVNQQLIERCISLAAAFIGYGKRGNGYKMPKTKIICDYRGLNSYTAVVNVDNDMDGYELTTYLLARDEDNAREMASTYGDVITITKDSIAAAAQHGHNSRTSWSHSIELFFDKIVSGDDADFETMIGYIVHEMIHAKQTTTRRLTTSGQNGTFKWDGVTHTASDDYEEYMNYPWEKEAYGKTPEIVTNIMSFLRTGAVKGFNPKHV